MRTKTILLSGVVAALSSASIMAQVYSLNAVGYINVTVPQNFSIIANQLNTTNNNISPLLDSQLLDGSHNGIEIFKYSSAGYTVLITGQASGQAPAWAGPATTTTLNPGEAAFIYNPYPTNITLTFVGTVLQGSLTNALPQNFSLASSIVPQSGALDSVLGLNANAGDEVFLYGTSGYSVSVATSSSGSIVFVPSAPVPAVGQGFFYYTANPAGLTWVRTFNVN
jgi:hypothetical protein